MRIVFDPPGSNPPWLSKSSSRWKRTSTNGLSCSLGGRCCLLKPVELGWLYLCLWLFLLFILFQAPSAEWNHVVLPTYQHGLSPVGPRAPKPPACGTSENKESGTSGVVFLLCQQVRPWSNSTTPKHLGYKCSMATLHIVKIQKVKVSRKPVAHKAFSTSNQQPRPQPGQNNDFPTQNLLEYAAAKNLI